ncbi:MAG: hypothetical protein ABI789_00720 [Usitatibacter sp.]
MTELEILRKRRELVLMSAKLQRETVVRRLDRVRRHPLQAVLGLATSAATLPIAFKVGSMLLGRIARKGRAPVVARGRSSLFAKLMPVLKFLPALKLFSLPKFLNR